MLWVWRKEMLVFCFCVLTLSKTETNLHKSLQFWLKNTEKKVFTVQSRLKIVKLCPVKKRNRIKNLHCAKAQRSRSKEKKRLSLLLLFFFLFSPSKLPRDFFCCNPSKKDSLDMIKTSQSIWKARSSKDNQLAFGLCVSP